MRGSPHLATRRALCIGIIPAHAGLTTLMNHRIPMVRDHPRACGAHKCLLSIQMNLWGSSPRMRGSHPELFKACSGGGIIPAHAGLTRQAGSSPCWPGDHPRACGAHSQIDANGQIQQGSSPRMRGSQFTNKRVEFLHGIIPAHAGLTTRARSIVSARRDHPRACGAHQTYSEPKTCPKGSSPRMRGSPACFCRSEKVIGIIPAHAGLTL